MKLNCAGDRPLRLLAFTSQQLALITFLPVHTARRYMPPIEWLVVMRSSDWRIEVASDCLKFHTSLLVRQLLHITMLQPFVNWVTNNL